MLLKCLRANFAKDIQIVDAQSSDVISAWAMAECDVMIAVLVSAGIYECLHHATAPEIRRAISHLIDRAFRRDGIDLATREADVRQLPVAQLLQSDP